MNFADKTKIQINEIINKAYDKVRQNEQMLIGEPLLGVVEVPKNKTHGDYTASHAFNAAKKLGLTPEKAASILGALINIDNSYFIKQNPTKKGFINFILGEKWYKEVLEAVERLGESYGNEYGHVNKLIQSNEGLTSAERLKKYNIDESLKNREDRGNPIYYIQYAHARISAIERNLKAVGYSVPPLEEIHITDLNTAEEKELIKKIALLPEQAESAADNNSMILFFDYATQLATCFYEFYRRCPISIEDKNLKLARLKLADLTKIVLANCIRILGI